MINEEFFGNFDSYSNVETIKVAEDDQPKHIQVMKNQYSIGSALKVCGLKKNQIEEVFTETLQVFKTNGT